MAGFFYLIAAVVAVVSAAPPPAQQRYPQQQGLHQLNPLDYFLEQPVDNYYRPAEPKPVSTNPNGAPARLESLEPDSEVELVPGVQQPQQPPQQNPVAPNIPGLLPGQRVFIVHMPIPGYSPGSIGGYQPVYIVAAGPQGNGRFPGNGYQNAVLLDPSGQGVLNPFGAYPRGLVQPQLGAPLAYPNRPYDLVYQDHGLANPAGQQVQGEPGRGPIHFSQNVGLQGPVNHAGYQGPAAQLGHPGAQLVHPGAQLVQPGPQLVHPGAQLVHPGGQLVHPGAQLAHPSQANTRAPNGAPAQLKQENEETKEAVEVKSNHRAQALTRNKA